MNVADDIVGLEQRVFDGQKIARRVIEPRRGHPIAVLPVRIINAGLDEDGKATFGSFQLGRIRVVMIDVPTRSDALAFLGPVLWSFKIKYRVVFNLLKLAGLIRKKADTKKSNASKENQTFGSLVDENSVAIEKYSRLNVGDQRSGFPTRFHTKAFVCRSLAKETRHS
mgnify:CR=1 FL=1